MHFARRHCPHLIALLLALGAAHAVSGEEGQLRYIHDELRVDMRTGPTFQYRIIDYLPSGTPVRVLEEQDSWLHVEARGKEGWIQLQYTSTQPTARMRLEAAEADLGRVQQERDALDERLRAVSDEAAQLRAAAETASAEAAGLREELAQLQRVSSSAVETANRLEDTLAENAALSGRVEALDAENTRLASDNLVAGIQWGAGAVLLGVILTWIIASVSGGRKKSDWV